MPSPARPHGPVHLGGEIGEIDGLRGIAILAVMIHRLWPRDAVNRFSVAADAGWIGVDLFFVVSGFLITRILLETRGEPGYFRNFYARRVLRIFPLYYLFVGALLVAFPLAGNTEYLDHSGSPLWYLTFLGNVPEALLGKDPPYWLAPVWSLAIEEQFYLTFPWLVYWLGPQRLGRLLIALFLLAPVVRLGTMLAAPDQERIQYLFTLCRVDAIAAGCGVALVVRWRNVSSLRGLAVLVACCAGAVAVVSDLDRTTTFGRVAGYSFVAIGFAALLLAVLLGRARWWSAPLRLSPLRYVGRLCFGLYLLHRPADTIVTAIANRWTVDADRISWIPIKIAVAVLLATVSWFVLEKPILSLKRRFTSVRHPSAGYPSLRAGGAALLVFAVLATSGCHVAGKLAPTGSDPDAGTDDEDRGDASVARDGAVDAPEGLVDAAPRDAMVPVDAPTPQPDAPARQVLYPPGRRHSPISPELAARLQEIAGSGDPRLFVKVGDSLTDTPAFVTCFDGEPELGTYTQLATDVAYFRAGRIGLDTPFGRDSVAATGGWTVADALAGSPCAIDRELATAAPRYALLLLGTNDNRYGRSIEAYALDLWTAVERVLAAGVVPVLSTLPPLQSYPDADARVPAFNLIVRALAQGLQVPLVDLNHALQAVPGNGLAWDGIHLTVAPSGACTLTTTGLQYGSNMRNLITLEALARVRAALAGAAPDASAAVRPGAGTVGDPFVSPLPLVDVGDTRAGTQQVASYPGCTAIPGFGHEVAYAIELAAPTLLEVRIVNRGGAGAGVYILNGVGCAYVAPVATVSLPAGRVMLVVDAPSASADGEYLLTARAR